MILDIKSRFGYSVDGPVCVSQNRGFDCAGFFDYESLEILGCFVRFCAWQSLCLCALQVLYL